MDKKKQTYLITGIILFVIYLIVVFAIIHVMIAMEDNSDLGKIEAINQGFSDMVKQPFGGIVLHMRD